MRPLALILLLTISIGSGTAAGGAAVEISNTVIPQGGAFSVTVTGIPPGMAIRIRFAGRAWPVYRTATRWRTYLGTDAETRPGSYAVVVEATGHTPRLVARRPITVTRVAFSRRRLTLDPDREALFDPKLVAEEAWKVRAALRVLSPEQLWAGTFLRPVRAPVSSPYGVLSIYNGTVRGYHRGTDFAAPAGTPVLAANAGIVRLAGPLPLSGNAVLIDHGLGVVTSYLHLSTITVQRGARVRKGDLIGRVGSTGIATGPNLHWGLRTNGVSVNPLPWALPGAP